MWYEEEIECAIDYFGLLHESAVNVGTLRRVANSSICTGHLEKSLSYSLVNDDESMLGVFLIFQNTSAINKGSTGPYLVNILKVPKSLVRHSKPIINHKPP